MLFRWGWAAVLLALPAADARQAVRPPNIVVIFIDDLGYGDIGVFGAKGYATPNLDRLAARAGFHRLLRLAGRLLRLTGALLTGCYNNRIGILGALGPGSKVGISGGETTLAEICKQKNYATACYGKWHLGDHRSFLPLQHGFDEYFGLPYSNDMWPLHPTAKNFPDLPCSRETTSSSRR
jgi:arylsulfatase A